MKRSEIELPEYFDRYIQLADDVPVLEALQTSLAEWQNLNVAGLRQIGLQVYAPGKWTIPDILQHLVDTERIFAYRALAFARGEVAATSYDENAYAMLANASHRPVQDLVDEAIAVKQATLALFRSFTNDMLKKRGMGFRGPYSVAAIGFIQAGHQRWHMQILKERYLALR
jgi:hypothetical protein